MYVSDGGGRDDHFFLIDGEPDRILRCYVYTRPSNSIIYHGVIILGHRAVADLDRYL